jgi:excisionase family DNA binding protein
MDSRSFYKPDDLPAICLRPRKAAEAIGISLSTLERLTRAGEIPTAKLGRCTVYPVDALKAWISGRMKGGSHGAH